MNFYYCRLLEREGGYCRLISQMNFYYCRYNAVEAVMQAG